MRYMDCVFASSPIEELEMKMHTQIQRCGACD